MINNKKKYMKKALLLLMFVLNTIASIAQTQTEHMKFKGIPMEGTLQQFTQKLQGKGYKLVETSNGTSMLEGEFASYKNSIIFVITDKTGMICKVSVFFPKREKWADLNSCYTMMKSMLTEKYGDPSECTETFVNCDPQDDNDKMYELEMDRCKYKTCFALPEGRITEEIIYMNYEAHVIISYSDKTNQYELRRKMMDDL